MGEVLEMIRKTVLSLLATAWIAGCTSPIAGKLAESLVGVTPASPQLMPAKGAPEIWLTLPNKGVKFAMARLQSRDGVDIFAAQDGTQIFLRDGMLIGSRGFGQDLMSAQAPAMATVLNRTPHQRVYFQMDGTDTMQREDFNCRLIDDDKAGIEGVIDELCESQLRLIRNQFTRNAAGTVIKSRQWLSKGVGFVIIEAKLS
jgi:hypothetical protein